MLELAEKAENSIDEALFELIEEVHDTLLMMVENLGSTEYDDQANEMTQRVLNHFSSDADKESAIESSALEELATEDLVEEEVPQAEGDDEAQADTIEPEKQEKDEVRSAAEASPESTPVIEKKSAVPQARQGKPVEGKQVQVRVDAELLGTLANYAGEVNSAAGI
jgi:chemotaxis protein histidine kinase CheA